MVIIVVLMVLAAQAARDMFSWSGNFYFFNCLIINETIKIPALIKIKIGPGGRL